MQEAYREALRSQLAKHLNDHVQCSPGCPVRVRTIHLIHEVYAKLSHEEREK